MAGFISRLESDFPQGTILPPSRRDLLGSFYPRNSLCANQRAVSSNAIFRQIERYFVLCRLGSRSKLIRFES